MLNRELPCEDCPLMEECDEQFWATNDPKQKDVILAARALIQAVARSGGCGGPGVEHHEEIQDTEKVCEHSDKGVMLALIEGFVD